MNRNLCIVKEVYSQRLAGMDQKYVHRSNKVRLREHEHEREKRNDGVQACKPSRQQGAAGQHLVVALSINRLRLFLTTTGNVIYSCQL